MHAKLDDASKRLNNTLGSLFHDEISSFIYCNSFLIWNNPFRFSLILGFGEFRTFKLHACIDVLITVFCHGNTCRYMYNAIQNNTWCVN